jgi:hypothetical protein
MRTLDDASLGRRVPFTMSPWVDTSLTVVSCLWDRLTLCRDRSGRTVEVSPWQSQICCFASVSVRLGGRRPTQMACQDKYLYALVGFGLACAPVRCAHPSLWLHCHAKRGAARPPLPIAASLLLIRPPKIFIIHRTWAAHVKGFFSFHWTTEAVKYEVPCPPIAASLILPTIILGSTYVQMRLYVLIVSVFSFFIVFGSFLFVIVFFFSPLHYSQIRHSEVFLYSFLWI